MPFKVISQVYKLGMREPEKRGDLPSLYRSAIL
jgi:hypothetical protein